MYIYKTVISLGFSVTMITATVIVAQYRKVDIITTY